MNKYFLAAFAVALLGTQANANADQSNGLFFKPYIGGDYQYSDVKFKSDDKGIFPNSYNGGDIHIGARVHEYFGVEGSIFATAKSTKDNVDGSGLKARAKLDGSALDLMGYYPIPSTKAELIGSVGIARLQATEQATGVAAVKDTETKARFGAGAQYWVSDHMNIRALVRYQDDNSRSSGESSIVTATIGVNWQFK
jgi:opacity protein-like surface antigen